MNKANKAGMVFGDWCKVHPDESFIGESDKSGGVEYFSVFSTIKAQNEPF